MIDLATYANLDAVDITSGIRSGAFSASEIHATACAALAQVNPHLNAVIGETPAEAARALAALDVQAPLAGVPFLIKDIGMMMTGVASTMASRFSADLVAPADTELAARFKAAGVVTIGRSNTPEFGCSLNTEPLAFGATHNPWSLAHSPSGSSGGAAAAVAAGIVPIAHANDGGGSIRAPASACGLVGLKPTRGRQPVGPQAGFFLFGMGAELVVSRSVRDTAVVMDATSAPDWGAFAMPPEPQNSFAAALQRPPRRLRIAVAFAPEGTAIDPQCRAAVEAAARLCEGLGHIVEEAAPDLTPLDGYALWVAFSRAYGAHLIGQLEGVLGRKATAETLEAIVWHLVQEGRALTANDLSQSFDQMNRVSRTMASFHQRYDIWLTPSLFQLPMKIGDLNANDPTMTPDAYAHVMAHHGGYLALYNVSGQPAINLPLSQSREGLPIGIHFGARFGDEVTLLQLAAQLEQAAPWKQRRPAVHVAHCQ
jgi:amidase